MGIPVISNNAVFTGVSTADWDAGGDRRQTFINDLMSDLTQTGFSIVRSPGSSQDAVAHGICAYKKLFALPAPLKMACATPSNGFQTGYGPFGCETAKGKDNPDYKEFWHTGHRFDPNSPLPVGAAHNIYPEVFPEAADVLQDLFDVQLSIGLRVLNAIECGFELPGVLTPLVSMGNSILRGIHYPSVQTRESHISAEPHTDINFITVLYGPKGLAVKTLTGEWVWVQTKQGEFVINIGEQLQMYLASQCGKVLTATEHMVILSAGNHYDRYSAPLFVHTRGDVVIDGTHTQHELLEQRKIEMGAYNPITH